ncbi:MAG: Fic family protein [Sulfurospirillaceae bacterium]|nr:Fic family protein [Sulfurospirillaceae bacterium]MCK9546272.1 Fic family protein [Sulfurospirillaceae bacterium]MDY0238028.1 Fic family protein [Campylobacterales bacterium]
MKPPYKITSKIVNQVSIISELITDIKYIDKNYNTLKLRKENRIKSIAGTLQIEGNSFDEEMITSLIGGKAVLGTVKEIEEVKGAVLAYENISNYDYKNEKDLLKAHKLLMGTILQNAGSYRVTNVGIGGKSGVVHIAPPPDRVAKLMGELFKWLATTDEHLLIASSVFHYEFEFIHPFSDGNGRVGRLWQSVILKNLKEFFIYLPIENIVRKNQKRYYKAIENSSSIGESTPFIEFMLEIIEKSLKEYIKNSKKLGDRLGEELGEKNIKLTKNRRAILDQISKNRFITINELSKIIGISTTAVENNLKYLKDKNLIKRVGSANSGKWKKL